MNFDLPDEHRAFRDMVRRWVDAELPKEWARKLEADEHNYPNARCSSGRSKFIRQPLPRVRIGAQLESPHASPIFVDNLSADRISPCAIPSIGR